MAVYTHLDDKTFQTILENYDIGTFVSATGIPDGVSNTNYLLKTSRGKYIFTLYDYVTATDKVPYFMKLTDHWARNGIPCPLPIQNKRGELLFTLNEHKGVIVSFLEGNSVDTPSPHHCAQVGKVLAQMHLTGENFNMRCTNEMSLEGWSQLYESCYKEIDTIQPALKAKIADELTFLKQNWPHDLPFGPVHVDLFKDNVFFQNGTLTGVIDMHYACDDFWAYDLAICINAWCFHDYRTFDFDLAQAILDAYQKMRSLTAAEKQAFPVLIRGATMRFLIRRTYDYLNTPKDAAVTPHDPLDYVRVLDFHQKHQQNDTPWQEIL